MQIAPGALATSAGILAAPHPAFAQHALAQHDARPWAFVTDDEARWLAALCDVFIPEDDYPSASQAGVVDYIDLQLATGYGRGDGLYLEGPFPAGTQQQGYQVPYPPAQLIRRGIAGIRASDAPDLTALDQSAREGFVERLSQDTGTYDDIPAKVLFDELLGLTNQGYFTDPIYLGNYDYAGWKMVGFPGAHAYYLDRVDDPGRNASPPPMGIAHDRAAQPRPPRAIRKDI